MQLELTDDQVLLRDTTRRFVESETPLTTVRALSEDPHGYRQEWWEQAASLGWTSFFVPERFGGGSLSGYPTSDAIIVAEEMGRLVTPGPFLAVNVVAAALAWSASESLQSAVLPGLAAGSHTATWAFAESGDRWSVADFTTRAVLEGDVVRLDGEKAYVEAASTASQFLVTAKGERGVTQLLVPADTAGVVITHGRSVDMTRRFGRVRFDGVRLAASAIVGQPDMASASVMRQLALALALLSGEMLGLADRTFEATIDYGRHRVAFGRPIVSFQVLKHRLAEMYGWLEGMKAVTEAVAAAVDTNPDDAPRLASVAKSYVGRHCLDVVDDCVQITGGMGVTWEHEIHLYNRRAIVDRAMFGSPEFHDLRLAELLARRAGDDRGEEDGNCRVIHKSGPGVARSKPPGIG